jgi:hypothetical protein
MKVSADGYEDYTENISVNDVGKKDGVHSNIVIKQKNILLKKK